MVSGLILLILFVLGLAAFVLIKKGTGNMIKYIYMFFVGLFVAIFLGTGIAVFYPSPKAPSEPVWLNRLDKGQLTEAQQQELSTFDAQMKDYERQMVVYNRNASMIALGFALLILIGTLTLAERLGVVANGLLLGGIFTLLYGIGRGMATDSNKYRFVVAAVGLVVTIALGYIKFRPGSRRPKAV